MTNTIYIDGTDINIGTDDANAASIFIGDDANTVTINGSVVGIKSDLVKINGTQLQYSGGEWVNIFKSGDTDFFKNTLDAVDYGVYHAVGDGDQDLAEGAMQIGLLNKTIENTDSFIDFTTKLYMVVGSITGQQADVFGIAQTGIKLESAGADYAEYLEKLIATETITHGDVVGVYQGKITLQTKMQIELWLYLLCR